MVAEMRAHFATQVTKTAAWRRKQLNQLLLMCNEHQDELLEAVYKVSCYSLAFLLPRSLCLLPFSFSESKT